MRYRTWRLSGWPRAICGWLKSSAGSWVMPRRSITAIERSLVVVVNETTSAKRDRREAVVECRAWPPRSRSPAPRPRGQPPADLDRGREVGQERHLREPGEADQRARAALLDRPDARSRCVSKRGVDRVEHQVRALARQRRREVLHHDRIGVERREGVAVLLVPAAKDQALGLQMVARAVGRAASRQPRAAGGSH